MRQRRVAFAIPGDLESTTGGYIYDRRLIAELRHLGRDVQHIPLGDSFPDPTPVDTKDAARRLAEVPADCPVVIDGLALGALAPNVLQGMSAPLVALIHHPLALETGLSAERRAYLHRLERDNLTGAAHVLVTSPHTAAVLQSDYQVPAEILTVARPGVDAHSHARVGGRPLDPPLLLSVGLQVPRKGHDVLLRALAQIQDRPWHAVIAGAAQDPDCAADLAALVRELELTDRVRFAGRVPDAELATLYSDASIFMLATRYEGYGLVFDEAMLHGLPIVTCDVGAVPDTVAKGAALLVPPEDPKAFAGALARLLDDPALARNMTNASEAAGRRLPGWDKTGQIFEQVLVQVETTVGPQ
ncbi:glycosyltransferase family 4 protein [Thalassococcus sp. S3]|uniref:glycosyltransferase family 4 protein n=1 Tax=Thalassococcus sp. S3 TaxID=2017482 RepID=UPI00102482CC|nr:glycosyltransferase family 4 protein [Thalassococcus sp. S3]QBF30538.1 glycosyl transferase family 1 [Thalassococcus sp. S3]